MRTFLTALATATIAAAGVWIFRDGSRQPPPPPPTPISVPVVQMPAPAKAAPDNNGELEGRLEPGSEVEIRTSLIDYPVHLKANAGDFVQKGQLLVELGDSKLEESVNQAEAALNLVKTEFQQRQARLAQSERSNQVRWLQVPSRRPRGMPRHGKTGGRRGGGTRSFSSPTSRSGRGPCKLALAETRIVAPISGYVIQRQADGELSKPDVVLMRIVDISTVKAVVQVSPQMNSRVVADQEAARHPQRDAGPHFSRQSFAKTIRPQFARPRQFGVDRGGKSRDAAETRDVRPRPLDVRPEQRATLGFTDLLVRQGVSRRKGSRRQDGRPAIRRRAALESQGPDPDHEHDGDDLERREQAAKVMAEASRVHFLALEKLIVRLREDSTASHKLTWEKRPTRSTISRRCTWMKSC